MNSRVRFALCRMLTCFMRRPTKADQRAEVEHNKAELAEGQRNAHDIHDPKYVIQLCARKQQPTFVYSPETTAICKSVKSKRPSWSASKNARNVLGL